MSRKLKAEDIKVGMLVRASRKQGACGAYHHLQFGAVCTVIQLGGWAGDAFGRVLVDPVGAGLGVRKMQSVSVDQLTRAPQATKRAAK